VLDKSRKLKEAEESHKNDPPPPVPEDPTLVPKGMREENLEDKSDPKDVDIEIKQT